MKKALVTGRLPEAAEVFLTSQPGIEITWGDYPMSRDHLLRALEGTDGVLSFLIDVLDARALSMGPRRVVANFAVGYDNIDLDEATRRGITVTNTPAPELVESTADLTWALILSAARRVTEGDRLVRAGGFKGWRPDLLIGRDVYGRTLGIVGPGRVGRAVARRARGFNMEVLLAGRRRDQSVEAETDGGFVNLPELLRRSDFVSLHTPLTPETRHLIGPTELGMMKPSAVLVNTSRGPVVDERALAEALKRGTIAAAALDVYEEEPRVRGELLGLENVVLLPHLGSATRRTREAMALMAARNLVEALEGRRPPNMVNPEVWKSPPG